MTEPNPPVKRTPSVDDPAVGGSQPDRPSQVGVSVTAHQVVAYNFRRARTQAGWTQTQTSQRLEPHLGYALNQAGVSAIERTFDSDRRRNIDVAELVAFSRCFNRPLGWFFLPPPSRGTAEIDNATATGTEPDTRTPAPQLATLAFGTPHGSTDAVITGLVALLVELAKLTPAGRAALATTDTELRFLAGGNGDATRPGPVVDGVNGVNGDLTTPDEDG